MRKIESEMLAAIRSGRNWAGGNTTVTVDSHKADQSIDVTLHGNREAASRCAVLDASPLLWPLSAG